MTTSDSSPRNTEALLAGAAEEIRRALMDGTAAEVERLCDEIVAARRIACHGVGREGLMMRALCMRLVHLGFDAHVVGDMTTPPLGPGDLLLAGAGPGFLATVGALVGVARKAGARTVVITARPEGETARAADAVIHLRAQTMADDRGGSSVLPMGSLFEAAMLVAFDVASILLRERTGQTAEEMRSRHTNLE
jgi:6-phospho-3-hexuloisomerase